MTATHSDDFYKFLMSQLTKEDEWKDGTAFVYKLVVMLKQVFSDLNWQRDHIRSDMKRIYDDIAELPSIIKKLPTKVSGQITEELARR